MRNSLEIAQYIEKLLARKGMKPTELAIRVGVNRSTISRYLNGTRKISMDELPKFASALGVTPTELLIKDEEMPMPAATNLQPIKLETVQIPILGTIACGAPMLAAENIEGYMYEFADNLPKGKLYGLIAKGDSMEPTIPNGSHVLIREQNEVEYGEIAAVLVNGDTEATLKRVKRQGDTVFLMPDNPKYEPYIVNESNTAKIVGKAIRVTKDLN